MSSSFWFDWDYLHSDDCCLTGMLHQVSVRFWPGLWRGSEGIASREELLLVMRDVEQVGHRIHLLFILECCQLLIRAQHLSEGPVDVTVEQIQLETGNAGGQVKIKMVTG